MITSKELANIKITPLVDTIKLCKISDEVYFSDEYADYISNSRLGLLNPLQDGSPEAFFKGKHFQISDSLLLGSAVHQCYLQEDDYYLCFDADRPTGKAGAIADEVFNYRDKDLENAIYKAADKVDYYKGKLDDKKLKILLDKCEPYWQQRAEYESRNTLTKTPIYLDKKAREKAQQCVHALKRNQYINKIMHPKGIITDPISENEQAVLMDIQIDMPEQSFIFKLKSKIDNYTIDLETNTLCINDVKTLGKILSEFDNNFKRFHYARELALYSWLMQLYVKKQYDVDDWTIKSNCLVVSTIPDYYTKVYKVTKGDFKEGFEEFKYLIRLAAYYYSKGYRFD